MKTSAHYPLRRITGGPGFHWFGYYDKLQFDPAQRFVLGMSVDFEGRSPTAEDTVSVGMVDLEDGDKWIELGTTSAFCWQQGCMLQWVPGTASTVIWNERKQDRYVSVLCDVSTGEKTEVPRAVYALAPDGRWAIANDFRRVNDLRPGYGYAGIPDPAASVKAPADSGIWSVDLQTGKERMLVSIEDIAAVRSATGDLSSATHYFNHLLINTDGTRFEFLHRWRFPENGGLGGFHTRMLTADPAGGDVRVVDPSGYTSHFIWKDAHHILAYTRPDGKRVGFYLFDERDGSYVCELDDERNGHCVYLPGNTWILNDTYPQGDARVQHLYLYHLGTRTFVPLGAFPSPKEYTGEWRCDLHPRFSPDGTKICFDSAHENGRQMYLMDIGSVVAP